MRHVRVWASLAVATCLGASVACVGDEPSIASDAGRDTGGGSDSGAEGAPEDAGADAPNDTSADSNVADSALPPACDPQKAFGTPTLVPGINSAADETNAFIAPDGLSLYLVRGDVDAGQPSRDIYRATRVKVGDAWGALGLMTGTNINTAYEEDNATSTADGLTMYFHSARPGGLGSHDIYIATRPTTLVDFTFAGPANGLNLDSDDGDPYIMPDGKTLFFDSNRAGGQGGSDLYEVAITNGTFGTPQLLGLPNSPGVESQPVPSADGLALYFGTDRSGGQGSYDIWGSHRTTTADAFGAPTIVATVNSAELDFPTWVSADQCVLFLTSSRAGSLGGRDIWQAERPK